MFKLCGRMTRGGGVVDELYSLKPSSIQCCHGGTAGTFCLPTTPLFRAGVTLHNTNECW